MCPGPRVTSSLVILSQHLENPGHGATELRSPHGVVLEYYGTAATCCLLPDSSNSYLLPANSRKNNKSFSVRTPSLRGSVARVFTMLRTGIQLALKAAFPRPSPEIRIRTPIASHDASMKEPPYEKNGSGMPVIGIKFNVIPTLTST